MGREEMAHLFGSRLKRVAPPLLLKTVARSSGGVKGNEAGLLLSGDVYHCGFVPI